MAKTLRERLASDAVLRKAFLEISTRGNPESKGPDGITLGTFHQSWKKQLALLRNELIEGKYTPSAGRAVPIAKKPGAITPANVRPITVFNIRERVVQRAVANLIWIHVRDHVFNDVSFGGIRAYGIRPSPKRSSASVKKNVEAAAARIMKLRRNGYSFTFETDIQKFFPSIDKERLLNQLTTILPDDTITDILEAAISTSVTNVVQLESWGLSQCWDEQVGVPQGAVLSPLFANLYLAPFDKAMIDSGFQLVRYVDDLVVLTRDKTEAERAFEFCRTKLEGLGLTIHPLSHRTENKTKTRIVDSYQPFEFLGLKFNKTTIVPTRSKVEDLKSRIESITLPYPPTTLLDVVGKLNRMLQGWMAAYSFTDFPEGIKREIDHYAGTRLATWMRSFDLTRMLNDLTPTRRERIGLWSVQGARIKPLSQDIPGLLGKQTTAV